MPNHFHFQIYTRTEEEQETYWRQQMQSGSFLENERISISPFKLREPSRAFNNMFIAYTRAFNKATGRTGALFERPFSRKIVDNEAYFFTLIVYIHRNPQNHGFVDDFQDWKWSSYRAYSSVRLTNIQREKVLEWFGNHQDFIDSHMQPIDTTTIATVLFNEE